MTKRLNVLPAVCLRNIQTCYFFIQMLTPVHNNANDTDDANDAVDYSRVTGIAQLKAFSCTNKQTLDIHIEGSSRT